MNPIPTPNGFTLTCGRDALWIVNNMAGAERRANRKSNYESVGSSKSVSNVPMKLRLKVYLDEGQQVAEIFVTQVTKCKDIVQRLQRQIQETDCYLIEVWQGCERLVPDSESIFSTLLEWGSDLDDVKFYLKPREEIPSYSQAVNGLSSPRVNGFKEETPLSRDVLLGGGRISVSELKEFAARQQQEIAAKEKELKAKQVQFMEMRRKSQNKPQNPFVQQLSAKADEQDQRLRQLRHAQDQTDSYKLSNGALAEELENVRSHFMEKEKELAIAVARVESLTQQLDKQRKGWSQATPSRQKTHQELELERLRKELMTRNELNHQQSVQIQSQKQLLAEKHKELFELDAQIDRHTNNIRQKRSQGNHISASNHHIVNGVTSPTDEPDFVEMDYSSLRSFSKRQNKTNNAESKSGNGSSPITSGSFRGRGRNARKLETLLEVEEEVSDGHVSNKSSTEDLTQGPGPPRASRVTELKSLFEAEAVASAKMASRFPSPARRVDPEGVEALPKLAGFDCLHAVGENRSDNGSDFFYCSSLKSKTSHENEEKQISTSQEEALEVSPLLEPKPEPASNGMESSSPSDGEDFSGNSSPLSSASSSSSSSNSSTSKAAVFAITGVVKKPRNFSPQSEKLQSQFSESFSPQRAPKGLPNGNKFENSRAQPEQPVRGVLTPKSNDGNSPLQARLVKSEGFSTKNENVGTLARPTVLDFSRSRMKPQQPVEESAQNNQMIGSKVEEQFSNPTEVESLATKLEEFNLRSTTPAASAQIGGDVGNDFKRTELKSMDSSVKSGKMQLSRLRYSTGTSVNSALLPQNVMENSESEKNAKDLSSKRNKKTALTDATRTNNMEN
ncbi:Apoptosis-stimulating of p53 protein 1 [Stylophora pistillata]|uniref:Apoptosis-stimulating of p53 protein 1 n=1 Tax=Stylophora pistillata TaxID=50429 RepID=A0A2B4S4W1_STYPI|nr:Apoptosis-stimulating of p53 protein 1 [Stylophora pistillata]